MLKDILSDEKMREDILDYIKSERMDISLRKKIHDPTSLITQLINNDLESLNVSMDYTTESLIEFYGRPALIVKEDTFEAPDSKVWSQELSNNKSHIDKAIPAVGRIELRDHPLLNEDYYGTAWLIKEDIIVTNRHVATYFVNHSKSGSWQFRKTPDFDTVKARIDFKEEHQSFSESEFDIIEVLDIPPDTGDGYPDVAFLRIRKTNNSNSVLSKPIKLLESNIKVDSPIVTIGYPTNDRNRIKRQAAAEGEESQALAALDRILKGIYDVKRVQPGYIKNSNSKLLTYDSTTMNKNSGSVVLDITTGKAVGLHFSGKYGKHNLAISSATLLERLDNIE